MSRIHYDIIAIRLPCQELSGFASEKDAAIPGPPSDFIALSLPLSRT